MPPISAVGYIETALAFTSNHRLGMASAQFDFRDWTACRVDLPKTIVALRTVRLGPRQGIW